MKSPIFVAAVLVLTSSSSIADRCKAIGDAARNVMQSRQQNADMSAVIALAEKQPDTTTQSFIKKMVIDAYSKPSFTTESN